MKTKIFFGFIAIILILGGYYFYDRQERQALAPSTDSLSNNMGNTQEAQDKAVEQEKMTETASVPTTDIPATGRFSDESDIDGLDVQVAEIVYDGQNFSPQNVTIKQGDIVIFKNKSQQDFWPASSDHPSHTEYPGFDAKAAIAPGKSFDFKFIKLGSWGFHDHLNPGATGLITVRQ